MIELIIVIAIIAVLGSAAFLLLSQWMWKSRDSNRISDLSIIDKALKISMVNNESNIFPNPDSQTIIKVDKYWTLWYQWKFWYWSTNKVQSLIKLPKDPQWQLYDYSISNDKTKYQLLAFMENDNISKSIFNSSFANLFNWKHIVTNYPGYFLAWSWTDYLFVKSDTIIINPSIIEWKFEYFPDLSNDVLNSKWWTNNISTVLTWDISQLFDDTSENDLQAQSIIQWMFTWENINTILNSISSKKLIINTIEDLTPSNSCAASPICAWIWCSLTTWIPSSINQSWIKWSDNCWFTCNDWFTWDNCEISWWRALDENCHIDDIIVWGQTWAWCNSTLWDWTIYNISNFCYNYSATNIGWTSCYWYNTKEIDYNTTKWIDNIRWKQYTRDNAASACPTWRHLPSDWEWTILENTLNWSVCRSADWRQCWELWWKDTWARKLYLTLKIPLAGYLLTDWTTYQRRWSSTYLWSSTATTTEAYIRSLNVTYNSVYRASRSKSHWFSVRCIKD